MGVSLIFDPPLRRGTLLRRYKRFLADIQLPDGTTTTIHCPNTGAMTGCSDPGLEVWFSTSDRPGRVYPHTLEVVCTREGLVGVNTSRANTLVAERLAVQGWPGLDGYDRVRSEVTPGKHSGARTRFDFCLEGSSGLCWIEVKSLTLLLADGRGAFPDAVSERAHRHLASLCDRVRAGDRAVLFFCVQHTAVRYATPADEVDRDYGRSLRAAADLGVEILAGACRITSTAISLESPLPVRLD